MNKILSMLFLALVGAMLFTSCGKDDVVDSGVDPEIPTPTEVELNPLVTRGGGNDDGLDFDCFIINYTFSMVKIDGTTIDVASEDDLQALFNSTDIMDFVYPLEVTMDNGDVVSVADSKALCDLFATCVPDGGWTQDLFPAYQISDDNSCFTLGYPLDLEDFDGNVVTVDTEDAFNAAIAEKPYLFVFPLTLIDEDDEAVEVGSVDELFDNLLSCNEWEWGNDSDSTNVWEWETGFEYIGCYKVEFPLSVIVGGEVVSVENHEELCDLMLQGDLEGYAYPLTLIDEDGEDVIVNNEQELDALLDECWDIPFLGFDLPLLYAGTISDSLNTSACYTINFPVSTEDDFFGDETYNNQEEFSTAIEQEGRFCCLVYPVSVNLISDNSTVTIDDEEDLYNLLADCQ